MRRSDSLVTHTGKGFQKNEKTGIVFIDLSSAYDTAWRTGLLFKFFEAVPSRKLYRLLNNVISGRTFTVLAGDQESRKRVLNNGLHRASTLAHSLEPLHFRLAKNELQKVYLR